MDRAGFGVSAGKFSLKSGLIIMNTYKKTIGKYTVEVETEIDSDPSSECWVECGRYSGSFECIGQTGILTSNDGEKQMIMDQADFDSIENWVESVGY